MIFRGAGDFPRHPSQLYQFFLEGLLLFAVLWFFARKDRPIGQVSAVFLMGYGIFRFVAEFFREPRCTFRAVVLRAQHGAVVVRAHDFGRCISVFCGQQAEQVLTALAIFKIRQ